MSDDRTRVIRKPGSPAPASVDGSKTTEVMGSGTPATPARMQTDADPATQLFRPQRKQTPPPAEARVDAKPQARVTDRMDNPVVGWLVVVAGPGKGTARELGYGMNSIGRSAEDRVSLDFGDEEISRHGHAIVTYDPRGRRFYAQHGGGVNLSYLDEAPLLQPLAMSGGEVLAIGNTRLKFVPFCGEAFDWQDDDDA